MAETEANSFETSLRFDKGSWAGGGLSEDDDENMDGTISRSTQTKAVKGHIASFDKLLHYAISRYSSQKLHEKLLILKQCLQNLSKEENISNKEGLLCMERSLNLYDLRFSFKTIKRLATRGTGIDIDSQIIHFFEAYFEDLHFLKELKRYFDERIHRILYEWFYDPTVDFTEEADSTPGDTTGTGDQAMDSDNPRTDKENFLHTAKLLYEITAKWDRVCDDCEDEYNREQKDYDPDSLHDILGFSGLQQLGTILRLIPDIFVKAFRASDYARSWLKYAARVFKGDIQPLTVAELKEKDQELKERVLSLTLEIAEIESDLQTECEDLKVLRHRENRHLELDKEQKKVTLLRERADTQVTKLLNERQLFYSQKKSFLPPQAFKDKCMDIDLSILKAETDLKVISFQLNLLKEDYHLEVLLLPEIVRYIMEVETGIKSLKNTLKKKQCVKHTTETNLSVLKSNCLKMKEVMGKYPQRTHSSFSVETNEAGDSLTTGRSDMTPSDLGPSPEMETSEDYTEGSHRSTDQPTSMSPDLGIA